MRPFADDPIDQLADPGDCSLCGGSSAINSAAVHMSSARFRHALAFAAVRERPADDRRLNRASEVDAFHDASRKTATRSGRAISKRRPERRPAAPGKPLKALKTQSTANQVSGRSTDCINNGRTLP